jgi:hypothetical protein
VGGSRASKAPSLAVVSAVVLAFAAGIAAPASAAVVLSDAQDASVGPDIASVQAERAGDGFRHRITAFGAFARSAAPCLQLQAGLHRTAYSICGSGDIVRASDGVIVARAKVGRPSHASISYSFASSAIGSPSFYRWRVASLDDACPGGTCDAAPDAGFVTYQRHVSYDGWARKFLHELEVSHCEHNRIAVVAWEANESTSAVWNPLATTYAMPGDTNYNSAGVRNYVSGAQGLDATRLTIERGFTIYGYGEIVRRLARCAPPMKTARAIKRSSWCGGCSGGRYVTGLIRTVKRNFEAYAARSIATAL